MSTVRFAEALGLLEDLARNTNFRANFEKIAYEVLHNEF